MGKVVKGIFAATLIILMAAVLVSAGEPPTVPQVAPQKGAPQGSQVSPLLTIKAAKPLPTNGLVVMETNQGVFFATPEGRFVIKGPLFDLWSKKEIKSVADIDLIASRVDFQKMGVDFKQLATLNFGEGNQEEVFFISPSCPHCQTVLDQAAKLSKEYRFKLVLLPQNRQDMEISRRLFCAKDQNQALKALLNRNYEGLPPANCPMTPLQKNLITARDFGITTVPYLVRHDQKSNAGAVQNLAAWLKEGEVAGGH